MRTITSYDIDSCPSSFIVDRNVTNIGYFCFKNCQSTLKSVDFLINPQLEEIGDHAFDGCTQLARIDLRSCLFLKSIGKYAFYGCSKLKSMDFSFCKKLRLIDDYAFSTCSSLSSINFNFIDTVGKYAFYYCESLESLYLTENLETIKDYAFSYCTDLTSVMCAAAYIPNSAFFCCLSLTNIRLSDSVKSIGSSAFECCVSLTAIYIPSSVMIIYEYAFRDCLSLSGVSFGIDSALKYIGLNAFISTSVNSLILPENLYEFCSLGAKSISIDTNNKILKEINGFIMNGSTVILYIGSDSYIRIDDTITNIYDYCFYGSSIRELYLPSVLVSIGKFAFSECKSLYSIHIDSIDTIGESAFSYCDSLFSVSIKSFRVIEKSAFFQCTYLNEINCAASNSGSIGERAFSGCKIKKLVLPDGLKTIYRFAFAVISELEKVTLAGSVERINEEAFSQDTKLTTFIFEEPSYLNYIERNIFLNTNLTNIILPANVSSLQNIGIENWSINESSNYLIKQDKLIYSKDYSTVFLSVESSLDTTTLNPNVKYIHDYCFFNILFNGQLTFPQNIERIGRYAFSYSNIAHININYVNIIDYGAFMYCSYIDLFNVTKINHINKYAFVGCRIGKIENISTKNVKAYNNTLVSIEDGIVIAHALYGNIDNVVVDVPIIGYQAFMLADFKSIYMFNVEEIQEKAFDYCLNITDIYIGKTLRSIPFGKNPFLYSYLVRDHYEYNIFNKDYKIHVENFEPKVVGLLYASGIEKHRLLPWYPPIKVEETVVDENHFKIEFLGLILRPTAGYILLSYLT